MQLTLIELIEIVVSIASVSLFIFSFCKSKRQNDPKHQVNLILFALVLMSFDAGLSELGPVRHSIPVDLPVLQLSIFFASLRLSRMVIQKSES